MTKIVCNFDGEVEYNISISPLPKSCWKCPFYDWGDDVCNATREEEEFNTWGVAVYRSLSCPFGTNHPDENENKY